MKAPNKKQRTNLTDPDSNIGKRALGLWQGLPGFQNQVDTADAEEEEQPAVERASSDQASGASAFQRWESSVTSSSQNMPEDSKKVRLIYLEIATL